MDVYSSDADSDEESLLKKINFSYKSLDSESLRVIIDDLYATDAKQNEFEHVCTLYLYQNLLTKVPQNILKFNNLRKLDLSTNRLTFFPEILTRLPLRTLLVKENNIDEYSLPKSFGNLVQTLEILNLSGNSLKSFPELFLSLVNLKYLYLGENHIKEIPYYIHRLKSLQILGLGGNVLDKVPVTLGELHELEGLFLGNNKLESLPTAVGNLKKLKTLQINKNNLKALPTEIVTLKCLTELNLRDNPLVMKFISDMMYDPPKLQEISARVIKLHNIKYTVHDLPKTLIEFLNTAHHCVNPKCKGVYFDSRVEHIKFVDFCGRYRVPLMQYLCSSKCVETTDDCEQLENASADNDDLMRKVLLG